MDLIETGCLILHVGYNRVILSLCSYSIKPTQVSQRFSILRVCDAETGSVLTFRIRFLERLFFATTDALGFCSTCYILLIALLEVDMIGQEALLFETFNKL